MKVMLDSRISGTYNLDMLSITCVCGNIFETYPSRVVQGKSKFCSKKCAYANFHRKSGLKYNLKVKNPTWFKKNAEPWNKGVRAETYLRTFRGEDALVNTKHKWVRRWFGTPTHCEGCDSLKNLQWSNKTEKYLRDRNDWQMLCIKCHQRYDYENFGKRKAFYE